MALALVGVARRHSEHDAFDRRTSNRVMTSAFLNRRCRASQSLCLLADRPGPGATGTMGSHKRTPRSTQSARERDIKT